MNDFKAVNLSVLSAQCQILISQAQVGITMMGYGAHQPGNLQIQMAGGITTNLKALCEEVRLGETLQQIALAEPYLTDIQRLTNIELSSQIMRILETLTVELRKRKFLYIETDRSEFIDNEKLCSDHVFKKFPLVKPDIVAAGNCLAAECHTAGVFHLMRAFEWALRSVCAELGLNRTADWDKKHGKFKYTPTSYSVWEKMIGQLPKRVEKRLQGLRPGVRKQHLQERYNLTIEDIKCVKDAWRNHVMHTRKTFERGEAHDVFVRVRGMMERMAK